MEDDEDNEAIGVGHIPVMPTLVMLQQMRNRLHLACLGRKLMKWSAMATGKELRKVSSDLINIYDGLFEDISTAYIMLARCRFYQHDLNTVVLEDAQKQASFTLIRSTKITAGVRYFEYQCIEADPAPAAYPFLGIGAGGQQLTDTKKYWAALLKRLITCLELRAAFHTIDLAHRSATKKIGVLSKTVIPKTLSTLAYALAQLEKAEIENYFKLKNEIDEFMRNQLVDPKEKHTVPVCASETPELIPYEEANKEITNAAIPSNPLAVRAPTKSQELEMEITQTQIPKVSFCSHCLKPIPPQPEVPQCHVPPKIMPYIPSPEPEMEITQKPKVHIPENCSKVVQPEPKTTFALKKITVPSQEPEAYVPEVPTYGKHFKIFQQNLEAALSPLKETIPSPESEVLQCHVPPEIMPYIPSPEPEMEITQKPKVHIPENCSKVVQPEPKATFAPKKIAIPSQEQEAYVPEVPTYGKHFKIFPKNLEAALSPLKETIPSPESEVTVLKLDKLNFPTSEKCTLVIPPKPEETVTPKSISSEPKLKVINVTENSTCESSLSSFYFTPEVDRSTISTGNIREIETEITTYTTTKRSIDFDGTLTESKKIVEVVREIKMPYQGDMYATGHTSSQFTNNTGKRRGRASKSQAPFHIDEPNVDHFYIPSKSRLFRGFSESLSCVLENDDSSNEYKAAASSSLVGSVQDVEVYEIYADNENALDDWAESEFKILRQASEEQ